MAQRPLLPSVLQDCFDLKGLPSHEIDHLASHAKVMILDPGDFLCQVGDLADVVWILVAGEIVFLTEDQPRASYASLFGEAGLLTELPPSRRVAIQAEKFSIVVSIPVEAFTVDGMLTRLLPALALRQAHYLTTQTMSSVQVEDFFDMLRCCEGLSDLSDHHIEALASSAEMISFSPGEVILKKGAPAEHVYVIIEGQVQYGDQGESISISGTIFGENGLLEKDNPCRRVSAKAMVQTMVLRMPNYAFTNEIIESLKSELEMMAAFYEA